MLATGHEVVVKDEADKPWSTAQGVTTTDRCQAGANAFGAEGSLNKAAPSQAKDGVGAYSGSSWASYATPTASGVPEPGVCFLIIDK